MAADRASQLNPCPACGAKGAKGEDYLALHVCPDCGTPQPLQQGEDYFSALGASRRFRQDAALLEKRFYEISRALHPDRFAAQGGEARKASQERMSFLNQAYQTLKNPEQLRSYILRTEGLPSAEAEGGSAKRGQIPAELAEGWFDLQDALMEDPESAQAKLAAFEEEFRVLKDQGANRIRDLENAIDREWETGGDGSPNLLEKLAKEIQAQSYFNSMERDIDRIRKKLL